MSESIAQAAEIIADTLLEHGQMYRRQGRIRPLIGGVFGNGEFSVMSHAFTKAGLDCVWFSVVHTRSRFLLSSLHETQHGAIAEARAMIQRCNRTDLLLLLEVAATVIDRRLKDQEVAAAKDRAAMWSKEQKRSLPSIPRRRKSIFEKAGGKCFYCKCDLDLTGTWHIEHMMPRALGGDNKPSNLVASCAPCNFKKNDKTADEFISGHKAEVQA